MPSLLQSYTLLSRHCSFNYGIRDKRERARSGGGEGNLPGDMYYRPFIMGPKGLQDVWHVGFIEQPDNTGTGYMATVHGNAGGANADWNLGVGSRETWRVNDNGLLQRSNQIGSSPNRGDMVKASKLETVEKVEATKFSFALD